MEALIGECEDRASKLQRDFHALCKEHGFVDFYMFGCVIHFANDLEIYRSHPLQIITSCSLIPSGVMPYLLPNSVLNHVNCSIFDR